MSSKIKKAGAGLFLVFTMVFISLIVPTDPRAAALSNDQIQCLIKECSQLLLQNKTPTAEQKQRIEKLRQMVKSGEVSKEQIRNLVKKQVFSDIEKYKFSRHQIGKILKRAPEMFPSLSGKALHGILWEKATVMLDKPITLKIGTLAPEGTAWLEFPKKVLNPHLKKVSKGKVILKMYVGGVMGEDVDILRKMDMGQLDGCGCTALGVFKAAPEVAIFSLPSLFNNYKEVDHILKKFRKFVDNAFEKRGYIMAGLIDTGFFYLWTKNKVTNLADIRKQKMMTWFGTVETATYAELGIRPTPISVPEVVTSLNTGLVDATYGPAPWILGTQAYTNLHYYVKQPLFYSPAAIIFSTKIQDQFRGKYPDILIHNFTELLIYETLTKEKIWIKDHLRPYEKKCIAAFEKFGIKPITLNAADMATIETASKKVWTKLGGKVYPQELLDKVLKELANYRKK